jgi:hypothetical protein
MEQRPKSALLATFGKKMCRHWTCTSIQQALKKQISGVFQPVYLEILNDNMVGYANISAREMLDHLFETYDNITAVDLEINFEHMHRTSDPHQPPESLFKQIQDCAEYLEIPHIISMLDMQKSLQQSNS